MSREDLPEPLAGLDAEALTSAILARTSGSPCDGIEGRLLARTDELLSASERELVDEHLAHCPTCRELADALVVLREELPHLAEIDPGPWFTTQVLRRTVQAGPPPAAWISRVQESWRALTRRPRFAVEIAYLVAMVIFIALGPPGPMIKEIRERPAIFPTGSSLGIDIDPWPEGRPLEGIVADLLERLETPPRQPILARAARATRLTVLTGSRLFRAGEIIGTQISAAGHAAVRGDFAAAWWSWQRLRTEIRQVWQPRTEPSGEPVRTDDHEATTTTP